MSEKRSSSLLLYDIHQSIGKIETFCQGISLEQLMADERTKDRPGTLVPELPVLRL